MRGKAAGDSRTPRRWRAFRGAKDVRQVLGCGCPLALLHRLSWQGVTSTYFSLPGGASEMNLPNKLTISRFVLTVAFMVVMFSQVKYHETIALVLFVAGGISDFLDGTIARRRKLITNFGILMDPLADKIMVCSAFIAFVGLNWMPAWMVVIIVARELAITGLRLLAASKNVVLAAEGYGKHKTISQIVAIISILVLASYNEWGTVGRAIFGFHLFGGVPWITWFTELTIWVAVALTFISGWLYLWKNRAIYLQDL
jgi:CDP-diacylglycerol---glycerol-3-phosphate 3-phosphatidyltransferase